ncbi:MAG: sorbosone dehydrogenase family protein [Steroidobacteraceae bacterium]
MNRPLAGTFASLSLVLLAGCEVAQLPADAGTGASPTLPSPARTLLPTGKVAKAVGWVEGDKPLAARGLTVDAFAAGLDHPRWLYLLPNGDLLVAETNAPKREGGGFMQWAMGKVMKRAGAGVPSADRITLLRDADGDGRAEVRSVFAAGLHSPFGMALVGERLFVANTDGIVEFRYTAGAQKVSDARKVVGLPASEPNGHWARNLLASPDGTRLYVTVGSATNIADAGIEAERDRAAIHEVNLATAQRRTFASGLRNPNGLAWEPRTGALWTVVNERDMLGSDLVPDYLTEVQNGAFYGWPWSYYGQTVDDRVKPPNPSAVTRARKPDYALGAHTASLGLAFGDANVLGGQFGEAAYIGQHGSWNRRPFSGYKVVAVPFADGRPMNDGQNKPVDVLTGFIDADGHARGRPVGVIVDRSGALLVADDVGNVIWRVRPE